MKISAAALNKRPNMMTDWDLAETRGYLDRPEFKAYTETVKTAIYALHALSGRPVTVADIRRHLAANLIAEQPWDALDACCGEGSIEMTHEVSPIRFAPKDIPVVQGKGYNGRVAILPPSKRDTPDAVEDRRVLA